MVTTPAGRRNGKPADMFEAINERIAAGQHVHALTLFGPRCINGPANCPTSPKYRTVAQLERELKR